MAKIRLEIIAAGILLFVLIILPAFATVLAQSNGSAQPNLNAAATSTATLVSTQQVVSYAPTVRTIWQAEPQLDKQTGQCSGSPVNYCSQLVALTPTGRNFYWKGQELKPYFLYRYRTNTYYYSGRNSLGDGTVKITLVLTSPTTFKATQVLKLWREPTCTHTMQFSGTFLR